MNTETDLLTPTVPASENPEMPGPPVNPVQTSGSVPKRAATNHLTLKQTSLLYIWLDQPENRDYVAKESDADTAIRATNALQFAVSPGNITGTRKALGILKFKPEKPADPPADVDLITLQKQLTTQGKEIETIKIEARTTRDAYNLLVSHVRYLQLIILQNSTRLTALPESSMAEFKDLKPLAPLPALTAAPATAA